MKKVSSLSAAALTRRGLTMAAGSLVTGLLVGCSTSGQVGDSVVAEATPTPETVAGDTQLAAPGVTDDQILFGQSAAFTGPAEELGKNMEFGIRAAFHEVNQKGGVHGRELVLLIADDRYEPELAIANTRKLIEELGVFALIGAVGTPTSRSAVPVAFQAGVPYIAPFTGAEILRNPDLVNVINLRASYYQETEEMVKRLTTDLGVTRIGVLYQDDSYGRAGYNGVRRALEKRSMQMVSIGVYSRNTTA
ncbi:MAG: ABC transporter substrate-binding protein, partial [Chloroflexota bacterium]|nr:ABC transporter substrate-binding protein [Chloroflexota bacterium]